MKVQVGTGQIGRMVRTCAGFGLAACLALAAGGAMAQAKADPRQEQIRKAVEQVVSDPAMIDTVRDAGYGGFYEVVLKNGDILYVEPAAGFLFSGTLIDLKAKRNVTADRQRELQRINFADLPLKDAVKQVRGTGKRVLVSFEDPNCSFCKKLARDLVNLKDTTIYTFLLPILSPDSRDKSQQIWCAKDRAKAWNDWMVDGKAPAGDKNCNTPLTANREFADRHRITGTPTMFLADGSRIGGYVQLAELDRMISEAHEKAAKK